MKSKKIELLNKDIAYLFSKIDFGKSFLDAKAITIMNNLGKSIDAIEEDAMERTLKEVKRFLKDYEEHHTLTRSIVVNFERHFS